MENGYFCLTRESKSHSHKYTKPLGVAEAGKHLKHFHKWLGLGMRVWEKHTQSFQCLYNIATVLINYSLFIIKQANTISLGLIMERLWFIYPDMIKQE